MLDDPDNSSLFHPEIPWCDASITPPLSESWTATLPTIGSLRQGIRAACVQFLGRESNAPMIAHIKRITGDGTEMLGWHRKRIAQALADAIMEGNPARSSQLAAVIEKAILGVFEHASKEYDRVLYSADGLYPGYAFQPDRLHLLPPRIAAAALRSDLKRDLQAKERRDKPWLHGLPRIVFIPDADDLLTTVPFEWVLDELVRVVTAPHGRRHIWLWRSRFPHRVATFGAWLGTRGITWPENLVPFTSVTTVPLLRRVADLRRIPAPHRVLSLEPMVRELKPDLADIDLVLINGLEENSHFNIHREWIEGIKQLARTAGTSVFVSHLGERQYANKTPVFLEDESGRNWDEWPDEIRLRELPASWRHLNEPKVPPDPLPPPATLASVVPDDGRDVTAAQLVSA